MVTVTSSSLGSRMTRFFVSCWYSSMMSVIGAAGSCRRMPSSAPTGVATADPAWPGPGIGGLTARGVGEGGAGC